MTTQTVVLKIEDETARDQLRKLISVVPGYAIENDVGAPSGLLIYEITGENTEEQVKFIRAAMSSGKARHVFLVSNVVDPNVLIQALKVGAKEFFKLPLNIEDVKAALLELQAAKPSAEKDVGAEPEKNGTIIHVVGSKGGVGTTTVAVNLAMDLLKSDAGKTVALIDMNLLFGDIPIFLGIESPLFDWAEIARNISRLDPTFLAGALYKHPSGLHVLPSPTSIFEAFSAGPEIITKLLQFMKGMFDYIVIDGGQDLGEMCKVIMKLADRVLMVTLLNLPCLINVKRLRETFLKLGYPSDDRISIVANRVHKRSGTISEGDAERTIKKKIAWTIPNDFQNTMNAINMGKPLSDIAPGSEINKQFLEIASFFRGRRSQEERRKKRGFFGSFV
ncbi:MAG: Septum site-determining protein MinD [Syntrophorhabdus sp. PtaU1.Bin153]|nr:MAG: Septum site-determining protein MinD [Syntrophorhabdus sp. PtaU1.Bin153]